MPTRHFTIAELAELSIPPDDPDDIEYDEHVLADEQVAVLKYTAQRRCIFRAPDDGKTYAVTYEAELNMGDFEVGAGTPDNHGWHDDVAAIEMMEQEVTIIQWLPIDHYEECPAYPDEDRVCLCEGINQAEENYREEPPGFNG
ncbi:MAG: hypothetical protein HOV73_25940 [Streptomyces sp.]|nr:hypothetical protein [Streptomyces sp.]NUR43528.1 hypothetical protein [Streptomyces sp.]NUS15222.1 hypothetical protein [Streptomyces sp.]NUS25562.1 hypothetical protein [Streptomyces sp.]NUS77347.1 hypothetical protein [Streptomyces sp.]